MLVSQTTAYTTRQNLDFYMFLKEISYAQKYSKNLNIISLKNNNNFFLL